MSVEFVVARRDLPTTRNDIRGKIRAGSLVRADHAAVREAPDEFFTPCRCVFEIEIDEYARDEGRWLRKLTSRTVFEQQPPPGPNAENEWRDYWAGALRERGHKPWDVRVQHLDGSTFLVRASIDRAVPPTPTIVVNMPEQTIPAPVVNVYVDNEPLSAIVEFERDPDGRIAAATITDTAEPEEPNGQLPD